MVSISSWGGNGIKDSFTETGLDNLSKKDFLETRGNSVISTLNQEEEDASKENLSLIERLFLPHNFRDMDFVFHESDLQNSGKQVYKQMLLLSHRWEEYNLMVKNKIPEKQFKHSDLGVFTNENTEIKEGDSVTLQLLKTPIPLNITTQVPSFDERAKKCSQVALKIISSGPEHSSSQFASEIEEHINNATDEIIINHMYFHPTPSIMEKLIDAAKRGVKIKIITCGVYKDCPNSHFIFGPRNKANYVQLLNSLSEEEKNNVEIYEFEQKNKGFHKKVIIIDDVVIAGSSNLGYKSLVSTSDYEINFIAQSEELVSETYKIFQIDIDHSRKIDNQHATTSVYEYFMAAMHRLLAPLIG